MEFSFNRQPPGSFATANASIGSMNPTLAFAILTIRAQPPEIA
jgi:hypothetical protein